MLLQGESGSGKELVANAIHQASKRAERPFIAVDCSGLPETLFESELRLTNAAPLPAPRHARWASSTASGGTPLPRRGG